ncbi:MAG: hypothetical protein JNL57_04355 [Bacteroidetes bacterium]|nr:hypothetical protein [Bacteroidota bacterium]
MKNITLSAFLLAGIVASSFVQAQNKEIPSKKPTVQNPPAGTGGTPRSRTNIPESNSGKSGGTGEIPQRRPAPVYRPPVYVPPPVYYPTFGSQNTGGNTQTGNNSNPVQVSQRAEAKRVVLELLKTIEPTPQAFKITDATKPSTFKGSKGFTVEIPAMAFVDQEGNPVLGEVEVKLTEYTDYGDFAAAGLTTQTTDGQILETGGMVNLEAFSGTDKLSLAQGKEVTIRTPELKDTKDFQTFYGVRGNNVQWTTDAQAAQNADTIKAESDGYTIRMLPVRYAVNGKNVELALWKNYKPLAGYVNSKLEVNRSIREKILKAGIPFTYTIRVNAAGQITEVSPKNREAGEKTLISPLENDIREVLKGAPALDVADLPLETTKTFDILFVTAPNYIGTPSVLPRPPAIVSEMSKTETSASSTNVNEVALKSSGMGLINCDRFTQTSKKDTMTYHFDRADALVYIVVKDMRSMIQPSGSNGDYKMVGIPAGKEVRSVAVVYDDLGGVNMMVRDHEVKTGAITFTDVRPFSANNLKAALNGK